MFGEQTAALQAKGIVVRSVQKRSWIEHQNLKKVWNSGDLQPSQTSYSRWISLLAFYIKFDSREMYKLSARSSHLCILCDCRTPQTAWQGYK